jgi:cell division protein FtsB
MTKEERYTELEKRFNLLFKKLQLEQQENISLRNENAELKARIEQLENELSNRS